MPEIEFVEEVKRDHPLKAKEIYDLIRGNQLYNYTLLDEEGKGCLFWVKQLYKDISERRHISSRASEHFERYLAGLRDKKNKKKYWIPDVDGWLNSKVPGRQFQ